MSDTKLMTGRDLGKAICAHFGLNINKVQSDYRIKTELDGLARVTLTVSLTPDDLAGIARKAGATIRPFGYYPGGLALVGEQGPEVAHTPLAGSMSRSDGDAAAQELKIKVDASEAAETLKRYGAGSERSEIAALTEEVRQLRKELNKSLYEVAKNTKRSADIADSSFAAPAMVTQTKATPVGGGPSASCSGQEGPRTGHFIDGHGIKHTNLGGQG